VVNARAQDGDQGSQLTLAREIARVRRETDADAGGWTVVDSGDDAVLALRRDGLLTLHNLAGRDAAVDAHGHGVAALAEAWDADGRVLGPYGFAWLVSPRDR
jgi:maltose alpha-D-glucosyltransferase/alpha-amylase